MGRFPLIFLSLMGVLAVAPATAQTACVPPAAMFATPQGEVQIAVEIANDATERARGLMGRRSVPPGQGMLFIFETPRETAFWMKDTLVPLDMVFMDRDRVVRHVHANAVPHDETAIPGAVPGDDQKLRQYVLEIGGGEAARLGIVPGLRMQFPIRPAGAAATCE